MALLSSHLQVRPGLLHCVLEAVVVLGRSPRQNLIDYLQPGILIEGHDSDPPNVVPMALDALEWLNLVDLDANECVVPIAELDGLSSHELNGRLPGMIRRNMLHSEQIKNADDSPCRDLVDALAWWLAQDAWDPPLTYGKGGQSAERRQQQQFPNGPEYVNATKWPVVLQWAVYLGLGEVDPGVEVAIPDPTRAISQIAAELTVGPYAAPEFVKRVASELGVVDGGVARKRVTHSAVVGQLRRDDGTEVLSSSLSLALKRLERLGLIDLAVEADTEQNVRLELTLPPGQANQVVDRINIIVRENGN